MKWRVAAATPSCRASTSCGSAWPISPPTRPSPTVGVTPLLAQTRAGLTPCGRQLRCPALPCRRDGWRQRRRRRRERRAHGRGRRATRHLSAAQPTTHQRCCARAVDVRRPLPDERLRDAQPAAAAGPVRAGPHPHHARGHQRVPGPVAARVQLQRGSEARRQSSARGRRRLTVPPLRPPTSLPRPVAGRAVPVGDADVGRCAGARGAHQHGRIGRWCARSPAAHARRPLVCAASRHWYAVRCGRKGTWCEHARELTWPRLVGRLFGVPQPIRATRSRTGSPATRPLAEAPANGAASTVRKQRPCLTLDGPAPLTRRASGCRRTPPR